MSIVGWVERSETHHLLHLLRPALMGIASLHPSYGTARRGDPEEAPKWPSRRGGGHRPGPFIRAWNPVPGPPQPPGLPRFPAVGFPFGNLKLTKLSVWLGTE
jgi:hypothetical protein